MQSLWRRTLALDEHTAPSQPQSVRTASPVSTTFGQAPQAGKLPKDTTLASNKVTIAIVGIATLIILFAIAPPFVESSTDGDNITENKPSLLKCIAVALLASGVAAMLLGRDSSPSEASPLL